MTTFAPEGSLLMATVPVTGTTAGGAVK